MIPGSANPLLLATAAGAAEEGISRSLRFNSSDSAYLSRVPSTAGNRKTWTWAGWVKRSTFGTGYIFGCFTSGNDYCLVYPLSGGNIRFEAYNSGTRVLRLDTANLFRDPSAWYHFVFTLDTSNATESSRAKIYVNGIEVTLASGQYPTQNTDLQVNTTNAHEISSSVTPFNGYLADIHFIDGQALDPTSFGEFDTNGVWQPKAYSGSYGTNGFHLDFADNSTAAALGYDAAGSNDWTVNNLGVIDSDPPTVSIPSGPKEGTAYANLWNGAFSSYPGDFLTAGDGEVITITWSDAISVTQVEYYSFNGEDRHNVNNGGWSGNSGSGAGWKTAYSGTAISLSSLQLQKADQASYVKIGAIRVNGTTVLTTANYSSSNDSLVDSPTNGSQTDTGVGGEVVGNYATLNPLDSALTGLNNGNLQSGTSGAANWKHCRSTISMTSGKWYWEYVVPGTPDGSKGYQMGVLTAGASLTADPNSASTGFYTRQNQTKHANGAATSTPFTLVAANDIVMFAFDADSGKLWTGQNGTWYNSGNPSAGTNESWSSVPTGVFPMAGIYGSTFSVTANFGQRPFAYTAPSGFKALCTTNLAEPTIADGSTAMDVVTYTGITQSPRTITGLSFEPDFVWVKNRTISAGHYLWDSVRGTDANLRSDGTFNEADVSAASNGIISTNASNGFVVKDGSGSGSNVGSSGSNAYVAWTWDAGSSTVTNNAGSIESQVRANASAGFSVVTYTGNQTPGQTIGHGLGVAPSLIIVKNRNTATFGWATRLSTFSSTEYLGLNTTAAIATNTTIWDSTLPTSSVFSVGESTRSNASGDNYVAYCWTPVAGYSSMGSYVGNANSDGPFIFTGFRPKLLLIKSSTTVRDWVLYDTSRSTYNTATARLVPNSSSAEGTSANIDILSNGFKIRSGSGSGFEELNESGATIVYAAWAENPFATARAR